MARLFGEIGALSIAGALIERGKDGGFDVPDEMVAELRQAFSLRDTQEKPEAVKPDVPAEIHEAVVAEGKAALAALSTERDALAAQVADLLAQLDAAKAAGGGKKK